MRGNKLHHPLTNTKYLLTDCGRENRCILTPEKLISPRSSGGENSISVDRIPCQGKPFILLRSRSIWNFFLIKKLPWTPLKKNSQQSQPYEYAQMHDVPLPKKLSQTGQRAKHSYTKEVPKGWLIRRLLLRSDNKLQIMYALIQNLWQNPLI